MELLLHESLPAEEIAELLLQKCGREKARKIVYTLQTRIEEEVRKSLKESAHCKKCADEILGNEDSLCGACVN